MTNTSKSNFVTRGVHVDPAFPMDEKVIYVECEFGRKRHLGNENTVAIGVVETEDNIDYLGMLSSGEALPEKLVVTQLDNKRNAIAEHTFSDLKLVFSRAGLSINSASDVHVIKLVYECKKTSRFMRRVPL